MVINICKYIGKKLNYATATQCVDSCDPTISHDENGVC